MCGLVGVYKPIGGGVCEKSALIRMRDQMIHRGPDGAGVWYEQEKRCALAHRRLSIIDLSDSASQPMENDEGSVVIVFNGEIYNHLEIRAELCKMGKYRWRTDHSDTEVLLHAYEEWGLSCVNRFYGMFSFAVYDSREKNRPRLHLVRDRAGVKPLYFAKTKANEWVFASEIRALLCHPGLSSEMSRTAFWHYLTFIVAPAPMTLFKGIFKLPAGHSITIDHSGHATAHQYWDCRPDASLIRSLNEEEAVTELTRLLKTSIERRMVSDVPFGVLLSGGVDSSMNVALMSELMSRPVTTFTIGYEGEQDSNEFKFARRISKRYNTDHHETLINRKDAQDFLPLLVRLQDEPIADNVCIPLYFLSKLVKSSGTTVIQVGEGADENFLGYWWCEHYRNKAEKIYDPLVAQGAGGWWRRITNLSVHCIPGSNDEDKDIERRAQQGEELFWGGAVCWQGEMRKQLTPNSEAFRELVDCPVQGLFPPSHQELDSQQIVQHFTGGLTNHLCKPEVLQKIPYLEMKLRLPEHLLMRVDKMTMAHSIEARVPFLDHDIIEFATQLNPSLKLEGGVGKKVLKRAAEPYLDHDMVYRKKQGFGAPMEAWFKDKDFGDRCVAAFERSRITKDGFLNNSYFRDLLKYQMGNGGGYSFHLWTVMNAILWHESWIEGNEDCF